MLQILKHPHHTIPVWILGGLLVLSSVSLVSVLLARTDTETQAAIFLPKQQKITWVTIEETQVLSGTTIPADKHVLLHLPMVMEDIHREVLFGWKGKQVRYWGYCFPENYDPQTTAQKFGFPGKMFLSEAERAFREELKTKRTATYSIFSPPTAAEKTQSVNSTIRHEFEYFVAGDVCYIMTDEPLALGLDEDDDDLNNYLENQFNTDPFADDSDGDGLTDGTETMFLRTDPLAPDTDNDGLADGDEDVNHNGRVEWNETNPTLWDSDRDGLCDGFCATRRKGQTCDTKPIPTCVDISNRYAGEDKNLSGEVDADETDPLDQDTDDDGVTDEQEYFNCLLTGKGQDC